MPSDNPNSRLSWLEPWQDFPPIGRAWGIESEAPGLLCASDSVTPELLRKAYARGIFPWYSQGQPVLWWSPNPRMVLQVDAFKLHPSLKKTIRKFASSAQCQLRFDSVFEQVIQACAKTSRRGQDGTWITPEIVAAYRAMHRQGLAHSVETWVDGKLVGGLYCVAIGRAVFGESMFHHQSDASKIALAGLVAFCRHHALPQIDCQQNTRHLASLGAREITRETFEARLLELVDRPPPNWEFTPKYWDDLLTTH